MPLYPLVLFFFGSCLGSFLNVVILRYVERIKNVELGIKDERNLSSRRSHCPKCQRQLRWWELVPIVSFIFLRGRCHRCGQTISAQYPIVEFLGGALVMILATPLPAMLSAALSVTMQITIAALLIILFVIDLKTMLLPDSFVAGLFCAVIAFKVVSYQLLATSYNLSDALCGAAVGTGFLLFLWVITRGKGIGLGDVKLMIPLGLLFGLFGTVTLLWLAYTVGGLWAIYLLLRGRVHLKTALPFGPFLCGAALLLLVMPELPNQLITLLLGYNPWP